MGFRRVYFYCPTNCCNTSLLSHSWHWQMLLTMYKTVLINKVRPNFGELGGDPTRDWVPPKVGGQQQSRGNAQNCHGDARTEAAGLKTLGHNSMLILYSLVYCMCYYSEWYKLGINHFYCYCKNIQSIQAVISQVLVCLATYKVALWLGEDLPDEVVDWGDGTELWAHFCLTVFWPGSDQSVFWDFGTWPGDLHF